MNSINGFKVLRYQHFLMNNYYSSVPLCLIWVGLIFLWRMPQTLSNVHILNSNLSLSRQKHIGETQTGARAFNKHLITYYLLRFREATFTIIAICVLLTGCMMIKWFHDFYHFLFHLQLIAFSARLPWAHRPNRLSTSNWVFSNIYFLLFTRNELFSCQFYYSICQTLSEIYVLALEFDLMWAWRSEIVSSKMNSYK